MSYQQEKFKEIADAIREKTGETEPIKPSRFASKVDDVYDAGIERVWYDITNGGERTNYYQAFRYWGLSAESMKPTHDIKVVGDGRNMFEAVKNTGTKPINFKTIEEQQGIKFDFSQCTTAVSMFLDAEIEALNVVDLSSATGSNPLYQTFASGTLKRIEKLIISENTEKFYISFYKATSLTHCIFEGVLNKTGLIINNYTLLDKESVTSIMNILSDDTEGLSVSIHSAVVNNAFETSEGAKDGRNSAEWLALVASKPNWTISL